MSSETTAYLVLLIIGIIIVAIPVRRKMILNKVKQGKKLTDSELGVLINRYAKLKVARDHGELGWYMSGEEELEIIEKYFSRNK